MGRPRKSDARDTRREILDAALEQFAESGFFGTSMRQIARAVGVRESALYHHFPSKEAILAELIDELGASKAEMLGALDVDVVIEAGVDKMLRLVVHTIFEEWATKRQRQFARLLMTEAARISEKTDIHILTQIERAIAAFSRFFRRLMERGVLEKQDPELVALEWMAPILMTRMRFLVVNTGPVDTRRVRALLDAHVRYFWEANRAPAARERRRK